METEGFVHELEPIPKCFEMVLVRTEVIHWKNSPFPK